MASAERLLDTDVLIDHLRGRRHLPTDGRAGISTVSRCELFAGSDADAIIHELLSALVELPVDGAVAELAGRTRRETGIATHDARIAATALLHEIPLMTRNQRHFDRVPGLRVVDPS